MCFFRISCLNRTRWGVRNASVNRSVIDFKKLPQNSILGHKVMTTDDVKNLANAHVNNSIKIYHDLLNCKERQIDMALCENVISKFDELSNELCKVADWADCLSIVHPFSSHRECASNVAGEIGLFVNKLNLDTDLYLLIKKCYDNCKVEIKDSQDLRFLYTMIQDFEYNGIHLNEVDKTKFFEICEKLLKETHVYQQHLTSYGLNKNRFKALKNILHLRNEQALLLGFNSYSDWTLSTTMAKSSDNVNTFIKTIKENLLLLLKNDIDLPMEETKFNALRSKLANSQSKIKFDLDYFLGFYFKFLESMYNIKLNCSSEESQGTWNDGIIPVCIKSNDNRTLGYIYLSLYANNKSDHLPGCHFTLFGRKKLDEFNYQIPRVFLKLSFPIGVKTSREIRFGEMSEFLHEFGHALHSILYDGNYQHLSGTRCSTDISEIPSSFMESLLYDWRFLHMAQDKHDMYTIKDLCNCSNLLRSLSSLEACLSSAFDLNIHKYYKADFDVENIIKRTFHEFGDVFQESAGYKNDPFQHFLNYGSRYYSYLWAQACVDLIMDKHFKNDIFCKQSHQLFQKNLLSQGNIKTGDEMMFEMCQKTVTPILLGESIHRFNIT